MIANVPGADRSIDAATEIALPHPRTAEPRVAPTPAPAPAPAPDSEGDPFLVAAQLESSAIVLRWAVRLALLIVVGLVVLIAAL